MGALLKTSWGGFAGAPGSTTMFITNGVSEGDPPTSAALTSAAANVAAFFNSVKAFVQSGVTWSWSGSAPYVDTATGELLANVPYTPPATVTATGSGTVAAPAGASIRWVTDVVVAGRVLTGRTFLVPLVSTSYESNGSLVSTFLTSAQTAANTLVAAGNASSDYAFKIWHRPTGGAGGDQGEVMAASVKDIVAVLRSRRD